MKGLTYSQLFLYSNAVTTFMRIQTYNSNVSTLRALGDSSKSYYQFSTTIEFETYSMGQRILVQNDRLNASNYESVQQN